MLARMFRDAMPDYHMKIDLMVADEKQVAARFTQSGTHTGAESDGDGAQRAEGDLDGDWRASHRGWQNR